MVSRPLLSDCMIANLAAALATLSLNYYLLSTRGKFWALYVPRLSKSGSSSGGLSSVLRVLMSLLFSTADLARC